MGKEDDVEGKSKARFHVRKGKDKVKDKGKEGQHKEEQLAPFVAPSW